MGVEQRPQAREPGGLDVGRDQVGLGEDERIARGRLDAVLEGGEVLVRRPQDHLVEAVAILGQPLADVGARRVVDDRQAVGLGVRASSASTVATRWSSRLYVSMMMSIGLSHRPGS